MSTIEQTMAADFQLLYGRLSFEPYSLAYGCVDGDKLMAAIRSAWPEALRQEVVVATTTLEGDYTTLYVATLAAGVLTVSQGVDARNSGKGSVYEEPTDLLDAARRIGTRVYTGARRGPLFGRMLDVAHQLFADPV